MNARFGFFPYEAINYKAAQAYLDRKAGQGWELAYVYLGCIARFRRAEQPSHFVDLDIHSGYVDTDPDYLQLCTDAGWELVQNVRGMLLFRAAPGKSPAPIQTDGEIEWERFWKKYRPRVREALLAILALAALAVLLIWARSMPSTENLAALPAYPYALLYLFGVVLLLGWAILYEIHSKRYLARCRRSGQVEEPGPVATFVDSLHWLYPFLMCMILVLNLTGARWRLGVTVDLSWYPMNEEYTATVEACGEWPVVMAGQLGLSGSVYSRNLEGFRSPFMDYLEYRELTDGDGPDAPLYILTTERYDCISEGLAKWAFNRRRDETRAGRFLWGELDWQDAPGLGFDESCICRDGDYLLLRQGKVVALVGCTELDLTEPQYLDVIRERVLGNTQ